MGNCASFPLLPDAFNHLAVGGSHISHGIQAAAGHHNGVHVARSAAPAIEPRERVGLGIAHQAVIRKIAGYPVRRLDAGGIKAETVSAGSCEIGGSLNVTDSFVVGGKIENTIDGTKDISIGSPSGTVFFTGTFDQWYNLSSVRFKGSTRVAVDVLTGFGKSDYGVLSLPVPAGSSVALPGGCNSFLIQQFLIGNYNPFF